MSEKRPAPYPADTRAKGWRFELDMETAKASETWLRARTGRNRADLMLLWGEAWQQTPCGSLPADDELIALILDMSDEDFAARRSILLRGWWEAEDGRLYHDTITARVLAMIDKRMSDAQRAATRRERKAESARVTAESRATHDGQPDESDTSSTPSTKHQAPSTPQETHTHTASALPDGWVLPKAWGEWAIEEFPHWTPDAVRSVAAQFADHWHTKFGDESLSGDWLASWRKWCRDPLTQKAHPATKAAVVKAVAASPPKTVPSNSAEQTKALLRQQEEHAAEVERQRLARIAKRTQQEAA